MIAYPKRLYRSTRDARARPVRDPRIGPGALRRLARILLNPRDWMIVAPQVDRPLTDWSPLKQTRRYGQVSQVSKTSVLRKASSVGSCTFVLLLINVLHVFQCDLERCRLAFSRVTSDDPRDEDVSLSLREPSTDGNQATE